MLKIFKEVPSKNVKNTIEEAYTSYNSGIKYCENNKVISNTRENFMKTKFDVGDIIFSPRINMKPLENGEFNIEIEIKKDNITGIKIGLSEIYYEFTRLSDKREDRLFSTEQEAFENARKNILISFFKFIQ